MTDWTGTPPADLAAKLSECAERGGIVGHWDGAFLRSTPESWLTGAADLIEWLAAKIEELENGRDWDMDERPEDDL